MIIKTSCVDWFGIETEPEPESKIIIEFENGSQQYVLIFGETWSRTLDKLKESCIYTGPAIAWCYSPVCNEPL